MYIARIHRSLEPVYRIGGGERGKREGGRGGETRKICHIIFRLFHPPPPPPLAQPDIFLSLLMGATLIQTTNTLVIRMYFGVSRLVAFRRRLELLS